MCSVQRLLQQMGGSHKSKANVPGFGTVLPILKRPRMFASVIVTRCYQGLNK